MPPTQEDVAARANVSRALVSLVFRDAPNVSDDSRARVLRAAQELGYRPNALARSLASKASRTIGVHINDITNPHMASTYAALAHAAEAVGYDLLLGAGTGPLSHEGPLVNTLRAHQVCGLLLESPFMSTKQLAALIAGIPSVLIGRNENLPQLDVVTTDELQAASIVVAHLMELGHRDIAHISGGPNASARARAQGYRRAMKSAGLTPRTADGSFTEEGGRLAAREFLANHDVPTAVIAGNDLIAVGAMATFREAGLDVPTDISVVGYDNSQIARLDLVQLTSVKQDVEAFGSSAVELLLQRVEGGREKNIIRLLDASLVVRNTTAPVRKRTSRRTS